LVTVVLKVGQHKLIRTIFAHGCIYRFLDNEEAGTLGPGGAMLAEELVAVLDVKEYDEAEILAARFLTAPVGNAQGIHISLEATPEAGLGKTRRQALAVDLHRHPEDVL